MVHTSYIARRPPGFGQEWCESGFAVRPLAFLAITTTRAGRDPLDMASIDDPILDGQRTLVMSSSADSVRTVLNAEAPAMPANIKATGRGGNRPRSKAGATPRRSSVVAV